MLLDVPIVEPSEGECWSSVWVKAFQSTFLMGRLSLGWSSLNGKVAGLIPSQPLLGVSLSNKPLPVDGLSLNLHQCVNVCDEKRFGDEQIGGFLLLSMHVGVEPLKSFTATCSRSAFWKQTSQNIQVGSLVDMKSCVTTRNQVDSCSTRSGSFRPIVPLLLRSRAIQTSRNKNMQLVRPAVCRVWRGLRVAPC